MTICYGVVLSCILLIVIRVVIVNLFYEYVGHPWSDEIFSPERDNDANRISKISPLSIICMYLKWNPSLIYSLIFLSFICGWMDGF